MNRLDFFHYSTVVAWTILLDGRSIVDFQGEIVSLLGLILRIRI